MAVVTAVVTESVNCIAAVPGTTLTRRGCMMVYEYC